MKILQIHKYYSKIRGGGSVTAFFELLQLLQEKGNEILIFSMKDKDNLPYEKDSYFVSHFDVNEKHGFFEKIHLGLKSIYNFEARKKIKNFIESEKPQIAHLHNIYHYLTPSIIAPLKEKKIPLVMTLHDYKIICPNNRLYVKGKICEKCKGGKYYYCLANKCLKNSYAISFLAMLEAYLHRFLKSYDKIDIFIAPSQFMKNKCVEFGIPEKKIFHIRNYFDHRAFSGNLEDSEEKNYILYYGRLAEEKGISDLIKAFNKLVKNGLIKKEALYIVGSGPEEKKLKKLAEELAIEKRIFFHGSKYGDELKKIITGSMFVVAPSAWHDVSMFVVKEAQLLKKPVIISDKGGIKENIIANKTGYIFEAGNIEDLAEKIKQMILIGKEKRAIMGQAGTNYIKEIMDKEKLYNQLEGLYKNLL